MPISIEENMLGAYNRAYNAKKQISDADFYV
jgi:non-canonical (house-cleaning) NTP pyrophosphatase